ncbi:uncharacterized protein [Typha latifolia]|uniref:uncharacterized protein n=1 Tax=Typha latifolia TaxID=4733 RepID=UPI003C307FC3
MKNKASSFLKQVFSAIMTVVKAKSMALKSKTSAMKIRLFIFELHRNKKVLMRAINHKIHAIRSHESEQSTEKSNKAVVVYSAERNEAQPTHLQAEPVECVEDDYPDLTHSLFNDEEEDDDDDDDSLADTTGSVIDMVRNSKEEGSTFILEDEIDHVADVFIRRFHKQMKMQKLESFKRYKEMMERSV